MKTELILPIELYKLGLEEIGAIFVLMASPYMEDEFKKYWQGNTQFQGIIFDLKNDEIIIEEEGHDLQIDLTWV